MPNHRVIEQSLLSGNEAETTAAYGGHYSLAKNAGKAIRIGGVAAGLTDRISATLSS